MRAHASYQAMDGRIGWLGDHVSISLPLWAQGTLVNELVETPDSGQAIPKLRTRYSRIDLLLLVELGVVRLEQ